MKKPSRRSGELEMGLEDVLKGATSGYSSYFTYIDSVAQEFGIEKATEIMIKIAKKKGEVQGGMIKEQAGIEKADIKTTLSLLKRILTDGLGIAIDVIEESPTEVRYKCGRCPIYDGRVRSGMDEGLYEDTCRLGPAKFMDVLVKQFNPKLSYQLIKFRTSPDDFCVD